MLPNGHMDNYLGFQQARLLLELIAGNLIKVTSTYALPVLTYSFGNLK